MPQPPEPPRRPEWPANHLTPAIAADSDWHPAPLAEFVVKVASRCNLRCSYCYVYELGDVTWRGQPPLMPMEILAATGHRIGEHAQRHALARVRVTLHGGEPLLCGPEGIADAVRALRAGVPSEVEVDFGIQTNGVLLDNRFLEVLRTHRIRAGVSLDVGPGAHLRRLSPAGESSYADAVRAIELLRTDRNRDLFAGILCVIDVDADPAETVHTLAELGGPTVDLLLPHATWENPPPAGFADWLCTAFDAWYDEDPGRTDVRLFRHAVDLIFNQPISSPHLGLAPSRYAVVDTDGALQATDTLKAAFNGAADTGLNVTTAGFDELLRHSTMIARQLGAAALPAVCQACSELHVCGGGNYVHRYRRGSGFHNPTVYCADMLEFLAHVRGRIVNDMQPASA